jgi:LPXTG-site transpeptidase (sortase) family protein
MERAKGGRFYWHLFRSRHTKIVFGAALAAAVLGASLSYVFIINAIPTGAPAPESLTAPAVFDGRLVIAKIGVDSKIESVGLLPDGSMATPLGPDTVGWYSLGPRPGQEGSAVIGGHRGWKEEIPAVFDHLDKLRAGDIITVEEEGGKKMTFVVRETRIYDKYAAPPEVFTSQSGVHLNLITCIGSWNADLKSTSERLVVFADLTP